MPTTEMLQKYARLAVRSGANVQKGQLMVLAASVECYNFARLCMEEAYKAGAGEVQVNWSDEQCGRLRFEYENDETLTTVAPWKVEQKKNNVERGCCYLYIESDTPGLLSHIPSERLQAVGIAQRKATEPYKYYTMANHGQWCIVAYPTSVWAKKVFPDQPVDKALSLLWDAVLMSMRLTADNDPVAEWERHDKALMENAKRLNEYNFRALRMKNSLGTDLTVTLVPDHVWAGGGSDTQGGVFFNPNMPTEEVFTMPLKTGTDGVVYSSKPLCYQGKMIDGFWLKFQGGKVVEYGAAQGLDALKSLVEFDAGSAYLGEIALVPHRSPISQSGVLFLNTLFDENASCHLALGEAYPENVAGGAEMTKEALAATGANDSMEHCDFMFGTEDLSIVGVTQDGREITVFEDGGFSHKAGFVAG